MDNVVLGGWMGQRATTEALAIAQFNINGVDISEQASISFLLSVGGSISGSTNTQAYKEFTEYSTFSDVKIAGGNPGYYSNISLWFESVSSTPVPIQFDLKPIAHWINPIQFPDDSSISAKAKAYSEFVNWKIQNTTTASSLIPFFTISYQTGSQNSEESFASCPPGTISGGCSTNNMNQNFPWKLTSSSFLQS